MLGKISSETPEIQMNQQQSSESTTKIDLMSVFEAIQNLQIFQKQILLR